MADNIFRAWKWEKINKEKNMIHKVVQKNYLFAMLIAVVCFFLAGNSYSQENLSQFTNPKALDDPFYRWNARVVFPAGKIPDTVDSNDYAAAVLNDAWDFNEGDCEGIKKFSKGISNLKVKNGKLCFTTGRHAWFYWGSYLKKDRFKDENIGANWTKEARTNSPWMVKIRLKQSLSKSIWKVIAKDTSIRPVAKSSKVVKGTGWQTVSFQLPQKRQRIYALAIEPGSRPGNKVEIDDIKIVCPEKFAYIRKTVFCKAPVNSATICLLAAKDFALYINGKKVKSGLNRHDRRKWDIAECGKFFHPGKNVIAYRERLGRKQIRGIDGLILEGIINYRNGNFKRFYTDGSWKGSYSYFPGWKNPIFDDSKWQAVKTGKNVTNTIMPGRGKYGMGAFIDPPYLGPIKITGKTSNLHIQPLAKGINLEIKLPATVKPRNPYSVRWELRQTYSCNGDYKEKAVAKGKFTEFTLCNDKLVYIFKYSPGKLGVYDLIVTVEKSGKVLDRRFFEVAMTGRFPMPEVPLSDIDAALRLKLIDKVNCADPEDPHPFLDGAHNGGQHSAPPSPKTGTSSVGKAGSIPVRFTGPHRCDWFSYQIKIDKLYVPHLIEVSYLDDRECAFEAKVTEQQRKNFVNLGPRYKHRNNGAVAMGGPYYPNTGKVQKLRYFYYPRHHEATVDILNLNKTGGKPPAIIAIEVFEINELPALKIANPSKRLLGDYSETLAIILENFYAGPGQEGFAWAHGTATHRHHGYYKNWYNTLENLIKYKRFCGTNLIYYCFWYVWYPYYHTDSNPLRSMAHDDYLDLMFDMFSANALYIIPSFELGGTQATPEYGIEAGMVTAPEAAKGKPTRFRVSSNGTLIRYMAGLNPAIPQNRKFVADILGEVVRRWGNSHAFAGVGNTLMWLIGPVMTSNDIDKETASYDDSTITRFEKESGIKIPVSNSDPERFAKRYKWLRQNHNAWKKWLAFYAKVTAEFNYDVLERLQKIKPDVVYIPYFNQFPWKPISEACVEDEAPMTDYLRSVGQDPELYKNRKNLVPGYTFCSEHYCSRRPPKYASRPGAMDETNLSDKLQKLYDNGDNTLAFVRQGFYETLVKSPKPWLWKVTNGNPNIFPAGRYGTRNLVNRLLNMTPGIILYQWQDMVLTLQSPEILQKFATEFRSIPMGRYQDLKGNGLAKNIVLRKNQKGDFYVVNPYWWKVNVELKFKREGKIIDLIENSTVNTDKISFTLNAYQAKVFSVAKNSFPVAAVTDISTEGKKYLQEKLNLLAKYGSLVSDAELKSLNLYMSPRKAKCLIRKAQENFKEKNFLAAARLVDGFRLVNLRSFIRKKEIIGDGGKPYTSYRVNCGSNEKYVDKKGREWRPDQPFENGLHSFGFLKGGYPKDRGRQKKLVIAGTPAPRIYFYERAGVGEKAYSFKVPPGRYRVTLYYALTFEDKSYWDKRYTRETLPKIPPVIINGKKADKGGFDIYTNVGLKKPYQQSYIVYVKNGLITIGFAKNWFINAIGIAPE